MHSNAPVYVSHATLVTMLLQFSVFLKCRHETVQDVNPVDLRIMLAKA